jgi:hypothetical protein
VEKAHPVVEREGVDPERRPGLGRLRLGRIILGRVLLGFGHPSHLLAPSL